MMEAFNGSGSSAQGNQQAMQQLMQQKMLEEMFGISAAAEPVDMDAHVAGADQNGSFGVVGVRLMPPTPSMPVPQLQLESNGKLSIRPGDLDKISAFFQKISSKYKELYEEQQSKAKDLDGYELFAAMLGR